MDTTPEYIKMCEKATEIQNLWRPRATDWFMGWASHDVKRTGEKEQLLYVGQMLWSEEIFPMVGYSVWLPRQDQLIELHPQDWYVGKAARSIFDGEWWVYSKGCHSAPTLEQALLKSLMKTKFNKAWTGEDWA